MSRNPGLAGTEDNLFNAGGRHAASEAKTPDGNGDDGIDHGLLLASVARDARLNRKYLLLISLSAFIATLGMLQNSPAVVIGAMLVSPLLGPIMGIGFGLVTLESVLVRRSLLTLAAGMGVAILVAMLVVWISPIQDVTSEFRARTRPTLLDLGVAVVGGVAGVYAIIRRLSGVMVGVAIATALVPPLSTIGFGLATWRPDFALGALLLFVTNTLAIAFAATLVARINRFGPSLTRQHTVMQAVGIIAVLGLLSIPLGLTLNTIALEIKARSAVQNVLDGLLGDSDRLDTLTVTETNQGVQVDGVVLVNRFRPELSRRLSAQASARLDRKVSASIVQLRQQSGSASELDERVNRRLAALERRDEESTAILADLTVGGLIDRNAITLDPQVRRATVLRERGAANDRVQVAIDRLIQSARTKHAGWLIVSARRSEQEPGDGPDRAS